VWVPKLPAQAGELKPINVSAILSPRIYGMLGLPQFIRLRCLSSSLWFDPLNHRCCSASLLLTLFLYSGDPGYFSNTTDLVLFLEIVGHSEVRPDPRDFLCATR